MGDEDEATEASKSPGCGAVGCGGAIILVAVAVILGAITGGDSDSNAEDRRFAAYDTCQQFVERRLKAPGTASFPNYFEDDGEVVVTGGPIRFTVVAHVDSENSFGASLRTRFSCVVTTSDGDTYQLVSLNL